MFAQFQRTEKLRSGTMSELEVTKIITQVVLNFQVNLSCITVEPVISTSPKEPLTLHEGDSATLSCQLLSGTPIPELKWRKCKGGSFPSGEEEIVQDVIKFESVTRDDSGCYMCQADNGFAVAPVTSMARIIVECK